MNWNVDAYQTAVFRRLQLSVGETDRVLDLGCGVGTDAAWLAERCHSATGVDVLQYPEWNRIHRPNLRFLQSDASQLPFPSESFDLIFMKDVLHHAAEPSGVLREAQRACAPGGQIYIVEGNRYNPLFYVHMTLMHGHQHFRRGAFVRMVQEVFPKARFLKFEAHVYPFRADALLGLARLLEDLIVSTPMVERFASYNAAIVRTPVA